MSSLYDLVSVSKKVAQKKYVNKKSSIVDGLKKNIEMLEERGNLKLKEQKDAEGNVVKGNDKAVLTERNQWWSKADKNGMVLLRVECKGKKIYLDEQSAKEGMYFNGGSNFKEVLATFKTMLKWFEDNMDEDTELFYVSRKKVTVINEKGESVQRKSGDRYVARM